METMMFNRYAVTYGDYVANRAQKIQIKPMIKKFSTIEVAKAATVFWHKGQDNDVNADCRSYWHDKEEEAILPPVVWTNTAHGAVGLQWWSKDRYAYWIIGDAGNLFNHISMDERWDRSEHSATVMMDIVFATELAKVKDADKSQIRARHAIEKREMAAFMLGVKVAMATKK
jgi:hypothetical protein